MSMDSSRGNMVIDNLHYSDYDKNLELAQLVQQKLDAYKVIYSYSGFQLSPDLSSRLMIPPWGRALRRPSLS